MAPGASHLSLDTGNGGTRIGRPPQWTDSKARKLARLYVYTTLPVDKIIKAVFPEDSVKYDLCLQFDKLPQKTLS